MEERLIGGRYRVTGTLGHGGMASVYRAVDEQLGREVAVKLFRIGPVDHGERARAEAEIHVLAGLRSPNLVTLFDAALDTDDGDSFLVMELVPGSDLATRLREGPLDPTTTARVGAQVAEGLAAVHAQGIVHRDVKPANVLLEQDGEHVKLADFGIALLRDAARVTGTGTVIGTAAYLAPEQVLGQVVTGKADVYALGLMLLEALTGKQAFPGSAVEAATARLARAPEIDQHLPTAWRTLLHVMTAQHPEDRPSAAEAAARLRALGRDEVAPATQLLPGGPGAVTRAAAGAGVAGAAAAAAGADPADAATRAMPVSGASRPDDATRRLPTQSQPSRSADDDVATTILGTPGAAGPGAGGAGGGRSGGTAAPARPLGTDPDEPRRKRWVVPLIVLAVLVVAGIVVAALAFNRDGSSTPSPTESTQQTAPTDDQPSSEPSDEASEPAQQPSQPAEQQPSEPAQEQPSEAPSQPSDESSQPTEQVPTTGPEPGNDTTLPVQDPLDTGVDTTSKQGPGAGGAGGGTGPGRSGEAPGQNKPAG
ncbi:serine/threonine-protein kinase [Curtobacterium herbarum]|uniref:non-specific serine/threonine protein kinase n=1 Tax=Curtobacterium herbarum TaxID=150122 RepID=A0ABP4K4C5_9MICO|nr:serine/threonine-protein kinase [Curtobacterium herbarum]MBM7473942.1 serine/threonine protein kinase [Curtobacterium herbarum]MCS6544731.1 protein kinase [Curtobacterium herbarum]